MVISTSSMSGSIGAGPATRIPSSWSSVSVQPAFHSACRRLRSPLVNAVSKTPAVASASSWRASSPARRDRSTWSANGRSARAATIRRATDVPIPRTESSPRRTAYAVSRRCSGVGSGVPSTHSARAPSVRQASSPVGPASGRRPRRARGRRSPRRAPGRAGVPRRRGGARRGPATAASRSPSAARAAAPRGTPPGSGACTTSWRRRAWRRTARGSRRSRSWRRTGSSRRSRRPRRRRCPCAPSRRTACP